MGNSSNSGSSSYNNSRSTSYSNSGPSQQPTITVSHENKSSTSVRSGIDFQRGGISATVSHTLPTKDTTVFVTTSGDGKNVGLGISRKF